MAFLPLEKALVQQLYALIILQPQPAKAAEVSEFCSTAELATGASREFRVNISCFFSDKQGQVLLWALQFQRLKHKETRGRFSRKAVRHKVGLSFQLLLWQKKVLLIPGLTFSGGKKNTGWASFVLCASCAEVRNFRFQVRSSFSVSATDPDSYCFSKLLQHLSLETDEEKDAGHCQSMQRKQRFCQIEPQLGAVRSLCLPSNPWPDKPFKLEAACVPWHLSVCLNISNSPGVHIIVFPCN